jgi:hypothetical protein
MKIHPVGAELFHANGRTDMTKLIVAFGNFAKAPKNLHCTCRLYYVFCMDVRKTPIIFSYLTGLCNRDPN